MVVLRQETASGTQEEENRSFWNAKEDSRDFGAQAMVVTGSYAQQPLRQIWSDSPLPHICSTPCVVPTSPFTTTRQGCEASEETEAREHSTRPISSGTEK